VDGGDGEAEEEVVCGLAGQLAGVEAGHSREVGLVEEVCVEPVDAAFVAVEMLAVIRIKSHIRSHVKNIGEQGWPHAFRR
jgi:hypothetical protein